MEASPEFHDRMETELVHKVDRLEVTPAELLQVSGGDFHIQVMTEVREGGSVVITESERDRCEVSREDLLKIPEDWLDTAIHSSGRARGVARHVELMVDQFKDRDTPVA